LRKLKIVALLFSVFLSVSAQAEVRILFEKSGFIGKYALGASYEFSPEHAVDYLIGVYQIESEDFYQSNLIYRYSRWNVPFYGNTWRPIQFGLFMVYAMNQDKYFMRSPGKYPYPGYYDETALRYGAEFSSTFTMWPSGFAVGYHVRIFDNGIIAAFNNSNRELQYYISSGLSLQYVF
jgi:hypothetical protein